MTFKMFEYTRPDYEQYKAAMEASIEVFKGLQTAEEQIKQAEAINQLINTVSTQAQMAEIRHSIDTKDAFYEAESAYLDEYLPLYEACESNYHNALLASPHRAALEEAFSKQYFAILENKTKVFSEAVIAECQEENKLVTEYNKLIASADIIFEGEHYNLSGLAKFKMSPDRALRKRANEASTAFFEENEATFDAIYDALVKVRDKKAKKLGFKNYVEYGYVNMNRTDYNAEMVAKFREQVLETIVPVASKLYARQQQRLNLESFTYYDENFEFESGNATPHGDATFILEQGKRMYAELSPETDMFFKFMTENELLDLETKPGKQAGGYCTYLADYKAPFIFSNFNGTSGDVDVLTHEAGHAFQVYQSRGIEIPEMNFPTYESAEIHSMSMEFITWPWMSLFFEEEADKYKYAHLGGAVKFIPYGIVVDAFQHYVYENPTATSDDRKAYWRSLEKQYLPHKNYEDSAFLDKGTWWFRQGHIFASPFYYIDYTLAQICALQFWKKMNEDRGAGFKDYLAICNVGGTQSFLQLVARGGLISPFETGCVASVMGDVESYLMAIDDTKL